ncbi:MAG TPA: orotidine 5'-phosphate decarboxylase / HUMPS family protein [Solirubrobacterales bacterium]|nr:orotidine 5'-phosphate decarboxylase / HUMPS family protein [Solirubrobacterales bacterium]
MFTIDPTAAERCDVGIVVPKMDERLGLERSWGIDLGKAHGRISGKKFWGVRSGDLNLVIAFLDDQGPAPARGITEHLLQRFDPPLLFLVGTAAGREDKTRIGDVIVSSLVVDLTEQRAGDRTTSFRSRQYKPRESLDDAREFLAKRLDREELEARTADRVRELSPALRALAAESGGGDGGAFDEALASGATLYVGRKLSQLWKHDDRYRAVDMESGGFASALEQGDAQWLVVRGVSDFGTAESKREELRPLAAAAAADFLELFLRDGLDDSHPRKLRAKAGAQVSRSEEESLYKALRHYWAPEDLADEGAVAATQCERALASGHWALVREAERVGAIDSHPTRAPSLRDRLGNRRRLQVALDIPDLEQALSIARLAADCGADFVEVGDPLIKQNGFAAITAVHEAVPEATVIAEMATSDWCGTQVEMAAAAGADAVLLLGCRKEGSLIEAGNAATRLQVPLIVDVPEELATPEWVGHVERAGIEGIAVIGNLDSGSEGVASLTRARDLRQLTELPIAISGGLGEDDFPALDGIPWEILIVGRAIVASAEPGGVTRSIAQHVRRDRPGP